MRPIVRRGEAKRTRCRWFFGEKKWESMMMHWTRVPMTVAMAAPSTPIPMGKTRNQSRNMFRHPPVMTAARARWGSRSMRRNEARKSGATITGKKRMIQTP